MITYRLFVVDDEQSIRRGVSYGLKKKYQIETFSSAEEALCVIEKEPPDLVLLDIGLPGMSGIDCLKRIKTLDPHIPVIMISAYEDIDTVVSAMKSGAHDYVTKPIHMDCVKLAIKNALETIKLRKEIQALQARYFRENMPCIIGESQAIQDVIQFVEKVSKSPDTPILIIGASGTGKELIAGAIHYKSPNFKGPFVTINCAAIPEELIESELFGYEKGAFSGANLSGKNGLIEEAEGGTLFFDEVGDLNSGAQAKLLRFLESGEFYKVGGTQKHRVNVRIVSATNKDLSRMIKEGQFRIDLFYRLAVIKVEVPSLNERLDDILPIAEFFLVKFNEKHGKQIKEISSEAREYLRNHQWTGNVRELRNLIEKGVLLAEGDQLTLSNFGAESVNSDIMKPLPQSDNVIDFPPLPAKGLDLENLEKHYLMEAYQKAEGNDTKAAKLLKMSYYSFRYRKKKIKNLTN
jgi:DNA-binding NtrC family response regulator